MVVSLYATADMCWFSVCWGHDTDVSRAGMCTVWFGNSTRLLTASFYVSLVGEGSFLVIRTGDAHEHYAPNIYRCIHT